MALINVAGPMGSGSSGSIEQGVDGYISSNAALLHRQKGHRWVAQAALLSRELDLKDKRCQQVLRKNYAPAVPHLC